MSVELSWPPVLGELLAAADLPRASTAWAMEQILSGAATSAQTAGFVIALRAKGETVEEIEGLVDTMYEHAVTIEVGGPTLDIVGSGGDRKHTVNISTMAAITAGAAGARVVKHGNRAASSSCGAADLLEELGVRLDLPPARVAELASEVGITFCFAPAFHPALRFAGPTRRELGVPTTFNFLGPLANPGRPTAQAVGVGDRRMAPLVAGVLARRGVSALVFYGDDGLDELTTTTTSHVWEVRDGSISESILDPIQFGFAPSSEESLRGGDAAFNAAVARRYLAGETGPVRDTVLLNAGAALAAYGDGQGPLVDRVAQGIAAASQAIDSGAGEMLLARWVAACV